MISELWQYVKDVSYNAKVDIMDTLGLSEPKASLEVKIAKKVEHAIVAGIETVKQVRYFPDDFVIYLNPAQYDMLCMNGKVYSLEGSVLSILQRRKDRYSVVANVDDIPYVCFRARADIKYDDCEVTSARRGKNGVQTHLTEVSDSGRFLLRFRGGLEASWLCAAGEVRIGSSPQNDIVIGHGLESPERLSRKHLCLKLRTQSGSKYLEIVQGYSSRAFEVYRREHVRWSPIEPGESIAVPCVVRLSGSIKLAVS